MATAKQMELLHAKMEQLEKKDPVSGLEETKYSVTSINLHFLNTFTGFPSAKADSQTP